jgi:hypothetical protein
MATPAPTDTPYIKYAEGLTSAETGASGTYNFLVSGKTDYQGSSGLMIKGDTNSAKGTRIAHDSNENAFFDLRTTKGGVQNISMRLIDDVTGNASNMLVLTDDDKSGASVFGASVTGRVKASQYHVGEADTRAPAASGVYLGHDASNLAYLKVNKGAAGTGGFKFATHNADGSEAQVNLELLADGYVKAIKYGVTNDSLDTETNSAIAAFDSNGQLVRSFQQNARFRSIEARLDSVEEDTLSGTPLKVNEIIRRLNSLKFFSSDIPLLDAGTAPAPYIP